MRREGTSLFFAFLSGALHWRGARAHNTGTPLQAASNERVPLTEIHRHYARTSPPLPLADGWIPVYSVCDTGYSRAAPLQRSSEIPAIYISCRARCDYGRRRCNGDGAIKGDDRLESLRNVVDSIDSIVIFAMSGIVILSGFASEDFGFWRFRYVRILSSVIISPDCVKCKTAYVTLEKGKINLDNFLGEWSWGRRHWEGENWDKWCSELDPLHNLSILWIYKKTWKHAHEWGVWHRTTNICGRKSKKKLISCDYYIIIYIIYIFFVC